jgi:hypothetical protein
MPKKTRPSQKQTTLRVGDISGVRGNLNIAGGNITTHQTTTNINVTEIEQLFQRIYTAIDTRPETEPGDKEDLKAEVQEIQSTVTEAAKENGKVDEGFLSRRFRNIARMAPDVLDVIAATLANPLAGLGVAARKIAEKAKEQTGKD